MRPSAPSSRCESLRSASSNARAAGPTQQKTLRPPPTRPQARWLAGRAHPLQRSVLDRRARRGVSGRAHYPSHRICLRPLRVGEAALVARPSARATAGFLAGSLARNRVRWMPQRWCGTMAVLGRETGCQRMPTSDTLPDPATGAWPELAAFIAHHYLACTYSRKVTRIRRTTRSLEAGRCMVPRQRWPPRPRPRRLFRRCPVAARSRSSGEAVLAVFAPRSYFGEPRVTRDGPSADPSCAASTQHA